MTTFKQMTISVCVLLAIIDATAATLSPVQPLAGSILHVGKNRAIKTIAEASRMAKAGDTVDIDDGDYSGDVATWTQDRLTIRGPASKARLIANGASAEGKAIWVMHGGQITIENIHFSGTRVPDGNGAGIRFETGHLIVKNCGFFNNENGILTSAGHAILEVENSEFDGNGTRNGFGHSIYVGGIDRFRMTGSYMHHANGGHLLKSRAAENHVLANRLTDEATGRASYELEFPNGGVNYVIGNLIEQGPLTENPKIVAVGAEGYTWPRNELYLVNNTIVDDLPRYGLFLDVRNGIQKVKAVNNVLVGDSQVNSGTTQNFIAGLNLSFGAVANTARTFAKEIIYKRNGKAPLPEPTADGEFANNLRLYGNEFVNPAGYDYRLKLDSRRVGNVVIAGTSNGVDLIQRLVYLHPSGSRALPGGPVVPGALQTLGR